MATFTGLPAFDYVHTATAAEVFDAVEQHAGRHCFIAGGTDLLLKIREGRSSPEVVIDLKSLPEMRELSFSGDGLLVGGAVSINMLAAHGQVRSNYPLLVEAAESMASYQLRSRATLAGNLCNASPGADMAPAALVYEAGLLLSSPSGEREVPIKTFFQGPGETLLEEGEFLEAVRFPPPPDGAAGHYAKLGRNTAGDLAVVGAAVLAYPDDSPSGYSWKIALASVAPTPIRVPEAEKLLNEETWSDELAETAAEVSAEASRPIDDVRASAAYRRAMVRTQTLHALKLVHKNLDRGEK